MVGDTEVAVKWMRAQSNHNGKVGLFGSCSGGRHAFIYACQRKDIDACADLWGGRVVMGKEELNAKTPVAPVEMTKDLCCPLLGIFGNDDRAPSPEQVNQHEAEIKKHGDSQGAALRSRPGVCRRRVRGGGSEGQVCRPQPRSGSVTRSTDYCAKSDWNAMVRRSGEPDEIPCFRCTSAARAPHHDPRSLARQWMGRIGLRASARKHELPDPAAHRRGQAGRSRGALRWAPAR
jgi:hypothetical protein